MHITIEQVTVHVHADLALSTTLGAIMATLEQLQAKIAAANTSVTELTAAVEVSNGKTDELITVAGAVKDALVALRDQVAGGQVVSAADLDALVAQVDGVVTAAEASKVSITAQIGETDAAAAASLP